MALALARGGVKLVLSARREHELKRVQKNCIREYSTHYAGVTISRDPPSPLVSWYRWLFLGLGVGGGGGGGGCLKQLTPFSQLRLRRGFAKLELHSPI